MNKKFFLFRYLFLIFLLSTLILILLAGCSNNGTDLPKISNYNVIFTVLDESSQPIGGAEFTLDETTETTDSEGIVAYTKPDGTYNYTVSADNYNSKSDTVTVDGNDISQSVSLNMIEYDITFTVTDTADTAIEGASVSLDGVTKTTDSSGIVTYTKPDGTYNYDVTASGYEDITNSSLTVSGADLTEPVSMQDAPIGIYDWEDLNNIRNDLDGDYILMNDLDSFTLGYDDYASNTANDDKGWSPIGNYDTNFRGTFDGDNFTISDLYIDRPDEEYIGLFGYGHSAELLNIKVDSLDITGKNNVGGIIGYGYSTTLENIEVDSLDITGRDYVGGISGDNDSGTIYNCNATITTVSGLSFVGGIAGSNDGDLESNTVDVNILANGAVHSIGGITGFNNGGNINDCSSNGSIERNITSYTSGNSFGGLVGKNANGGIIEDSYSTVDLDTGEDSRNSGGLVGDNTTNSNIKKSYAVGNVTGDIACGGLVGKNYNSNILNSYAGGIVEGYASVGGLIGYTSNGGDITNCYSRGPVSGTGSFVGGLIGRNYEPYSTITSSYWDTETSGQATSDGGEGRTSFQMQEGTSGSTIDSDPIYVDWVNSIWNFGTNLDYPKLD